MSNELIVMERKSYLDSTGVSCDTFALFFDDALRRVVLDRLVRQVTKANGRVGT